MNQEEFRAKTGSLVSGYNNESSSSSAASSSSSHHNTSHSYASTSPSSTALITYGPNLPSSSSSSSSYGGYSGYGGNYSNPTTSYSTSYSSWSQSTGKSPTGYVGLSNQGATCYMNSLIQSLYMTPEFRNALYHWSFDEKYRRDIEKAQNGKADNGVASPPPPTSPMSDEGTGPSNGKANGKAEMSAEEREKKEKNSIPLQLQRLFARLQMCDTQSVKTKDLTKSFGWEDADAFTQHDVQELCRVLFDALEKNFQGTKQANLVNELYQGKMKDYVQCKECGHEGARVDHYLDIPLVIRGFGETVPVRSVEEAMYKFVQPEVLDKDNQYSCEKCNKKVDAVKGLRFEKFPYLLTLQLKRFDFDFQTMRRIKLNDRVTFPLYLDLNPFISGNRAPVPHKPHDEEEEEEEDEEEMKEDHEPQPQDGKRDYMQVDSDQEEISVQKETNEPNFNAEPDFEAPAPSVSAELPYVYELFSVMIHRGSSMGGHYYAYIKSFETGKWYEFNDSMVSEISVNDVKKAFGGDEDGARGSMYSSYRSNANAYMLMYRQLDVDRNTKPIASTDIPGDLRKVIDDESGAAKQKKKAEELEREMVKMKIFYNGEDKPLSMHKTATLEDTAKASINLYGLGDKYTTGNYRLRNYQHYNDLPGDTYTGKENKTLDDLNFHWGSTYSSKTLLLETKEANEEFDDYDSTQMLFRVAKFDSDTNDFGPTINVYVTKLGNLGDLRDSVAAKLGVPRENQNLYKESSYSSWNNPPATLINHDDDTEIRAFHFMEPEKLYVEFSEKPKRIAAGADDDDEAEEKESPVVAALERIKNIIEVKFNLPGKEEADQKISLDKNTTLKEFKEKIAPIVGLPLDEFKVKRASGTHLYELINEADTLAECSIRDGMSLVIEKGRPLREGESNYTFEFFDISKETDNFTDLFEIPVHEDILISDLKKQILPLLQEKNIQVTDPTHIRLRDVSTTQYSRRVNKAFPDSVSLKKAMYIYSKRIAVQVLSGPEEVQNPEKDLVIFVQQFFPEKFEITRKEDFVINEDASLEEFREKLGQKFGIEAQNVGVVRVDNFYSFYDDPDLLEVPDMNWDKPTIMYSTKNTVGDTMMMRNGNLVIIRDNTQKLKELTKEEKDAIKKEMSKRKAAQNQNTNTYSYWNRKEKALKINTDEQ